MNLTTKLLWLLPLAISLGFSSCNKNEDNASLPTTGNWIQCSQFEGMKRTEATAAVVNDRAYIGTGHYTFNNSGFYCLSDFWSYEPVRDQWSQISDLPGPARSGAVSFSAAGKFYVGCGIAQDSTFLKDFYEYDPSTDLWTQIEDLNNNDPAMKGRSGMCAFSINDIGYVLTGFDDEGQNYKDMYSYNPATKQWIKEAPFPTHKRRDAVSFVIDNKAYVCTGYDNMYVIDFCCYDPATKQWSLLRNISDATSQAFDDTYGKISRLKAVAFASGGKGYLVSGFKSERLQDVWKYDPVTDLWTQENNFEGRARTGATAFTIHDKGYVTTGNNDSFVLDDVWKFEPDAEFNEFD